MGGSNGRRLGLLVGFFALSGCASLMDQVVWLRYLSLVFGNTTYATATLLSVFMGGLGLGALLFGRWADRVRKPLVVYALAEVGVALAAIVSPTLFDWIAQAYVLLYRALGNQPLAFALLRALLAGLFLLPPTLLMGGTLPLMLRATVLADKVGTRSALFYAINTLGAVAGVALAGFFTIRLVGLYATLLLAAGFSLTAALGALALSSPRPAVAAVAPGGFRRSWLLALFFLMGATSLAYEVLWTRVLVFYLGSSVYAYSLMLFLFLLGVGCGSLVATPWVDRLQSPLAALAALEIGIATYVVLQVLLFQTLNASLSTLAGWLDPRTFTDLTVVQLLALLPILLPPTFVMGVTFPLAVRILNRDLAHLGTDVGAVYGANTIGSVVGSLGAGFVLIPLLGSQNSLFAVALVNALLGAAVWAARPVPGPRRWLATAAPACILLVLPLFPPHRAVLAAGMFRHDRPEDLVHFEEDAHATVTIRRLWSPHGPYLSLELNGVNVAGTSPDLYVIQKMQGHLPMLLATQAEEVVHIGFGSGGTAHAVSLYPVEEILIVEISPAVIRASDRYFEPINHGVLSDPRAAVEINDGRNFLMATPRRFDAILSDSIHPRYAGNGSLYSLEYFRLVRRRLAPGGAVSMWLPMYSLRPRNYAMILRAFSQVFPHTAVWYVPSTLNSFTIVTGKLGPAPWTAESLARSFEDPHIAKELREIGISGPADIVASYMIGGERLQRWLENVPPHSDDLPAVEYESGTLIHKDLTWLQIFRLLLAQRPHEPPATYLEALLPAEQERARRLFEERRWVLEDHFRFLEQQILGRAAGSPSPAPDPG